MFKKILEKQGWVKVKELPNHIVEKIEKARKDEHDRCKVEYEEKIEALKSRLEMDHSIDIKDLESKISFLNREIEFLKGKVKDAENIYNTCWRQIKSNLQVSAESKFQMKKLLENFQVIFQSLSMIESAAEKQNENMLLHDEDFRKTLDLPKK